MVGGAELAELDAEAADANAGEVLCLPYFLGEKSPIHDPDLRGAFAGMHLGHTRAALYRAVLEAIAFRFRHHVDVFTDIGIPMTHVDPGPPCGSRSMPMCSASNCTPSGAHPGASLGAAVIAAIGVGALDDWADAARFVSLQPPVVPDPSRRGLYDDAYQRWRELGDVMAPISHAIARSARR